MSVSTSRETERERDNKGGTAHALRSLVDEQASNGSAAAAPAGNGVPGSASPPAGNGGAAAQGGMVLERQGIARALQECRKSKPHVVFTDRPNNYVMYPAKHWDTEGTLVTLVLDRVLWTQWFPV